MHEIKPLREIQPWTATEKELTRLKAMADDDLLRFSASLDMFAVVESNRRLRVALHTEERAIKWLTGVLIALTLILIGLGIIEIFLRR